MKKLLALVMSLCLLCACCAYAEETVEINWSDVEEQASAIEGQFAPIADLGVMMFIPAVFGSAEVTEEQAKEALRLASHKLPVKCKVVSRADLEGGNGSEN